jgi:hypothetical protein
MSDERMMTCKGFGKKGSWPNFKALSRHSPGGSTTKKLSEDSRSPGIDLKAGPPEYEAGVLTTQPRRSVSRVEAGCSCNMVLCTHKSTWRYNPEDEHMRSVCCTCYLVYVVNPEACSPQCAVQRVCLMRDQPVPDSVHRCLSNTKEVHLKVPSTERDAGKSGVRCLGYQKRCR